MKILYDAGVCLYTYGIRIYSLFNDKAKLWVKGRERIFERMRQEGLGERKTAWFHAASLGEFEQGRPVIERFRQEFPEYTILLTFFSPSGYEIRKKYPGADYVFYLPADTRKNARHFVSIVKPSLAVFIKYEFWLNYIDCLTKLAIPVISISSLFRENQYYFKWYGIFGLKRLEKVAHFFVQNERSLTLLRKAGIMQVTLSGDTRFDRVAELKRINRAFPELEKLIGGRSVFLAGSSWEPDEEKILPLIDLHPDMVFVFAPHVVDERRIAFLGKTFEVFGVIKYSAINRPVEGKIRVIIIDSVGILSHLYKYATIAYIGGGFGRGIHNILEAATFGKPVIFGPEYGKFQEAVDLVQTGGAFSVRSADELKETVAFLCANESGMRAGESCRMYTDEKQGATDIILKELKNILPPISSRKKVKKG